MTQSKLNKNITDTQLLKQAAYLARKGYIKCRHK